MKKRRSTDLPSRKSHQFFFFTSIQYSEIKNAEYSFSYFQQIGSGYAIYNDFLLSNNLKSGDYEKLPVPHKYIEGMFLKCFPYLLSCLFCFIVLGKGMYLRHIFSFDSVKWFLITCSYDNCDELQFYYF